MRQSSAKEEICKQGPRIKQVAKWVIKSMVFFQAFSSAFQQYKAFGPFSSNTGTAAIMQKLHQPQEHRSKKKISYRKPKT